MSGRLWRRDLRPPSDSLGAGPERQTLEGLTQSDSWAEGYECLEAGPGGANLEPWGWAFVSRCRGRTKRDLTGGGV